MKGSARAGTVIAAPVNAEERLLKVCASVSDKKQLGFKFIKVLNGIACLLLGGNDTGTMKKN